MMGFQRRFDERILQCLQMAGLGKLAETPAGLDLAHEEWDDVLSGGERQRVGARKVFTGPGAPLSGAASPPAPGGARASCAA